MKDGKVTFHDAAGMAVGGFAQVVTSPAQVWQKDVKYSKVRIGTGNISVRANGFYIVKSPGKLESDLPMIIDGGLFEVEAGTTTVFTDRLPFSVCSVLMYSGEFVISDGAVVSAVGVVEADGGKLSTKVSTGNSKVATLDTPKFKNDGADVSIHAVPPGQQDTSHSAGQLTCTGEVEWTGGTYRPVINVGNNNADLWYAGGKIAVGTNAKLAPATVSGVPTQNASFPILESALQIVGTPPAIDSPTVGYEVTIGGNPVKKWYLRKT